MNLALTDRMRPLFRVLHNGHESPVTIYSPMFYIEVKMHAGSRLKLPMEYRERAIYLLDGGLRIGATRIAPLTMTVFVQEQAITL